MMRIVNEPQRHKTPRPDALASAVADGPQAAQRSSLLAGKLIDLDVVSLVVEQGSTDTNVHRASDIVRITTSGCGALKQGVDTWRTAS